MKTKTLLLIVCIITAAGLHQSRAQDIHFSQFWMTPLIQNPSLAGANYDMEGILNYKSQWGSFTVPYKTFDASFDMTVRKSRRKQGFFGVGINLFSDKAGDSQMGTLQANLNLAYHIKLDGQNTLGAGFMGGFGQRSINYSALQWGSQYDGMAYNSTLSNGEPIGSSSKKFIDGGAGIIWTYEKGEEYMTANDRVKINFGFAVYHPHQPKYSFYNSDEELRAKFVVHGTFLYGFRNTDFSLVPGFMYYRQGGSQEILAGSLFRYILKESSKYTGYISGSALSAGVHFRTQDAAIASFFLEKGLYTLGFSYDLNTSDLKPASGMQGGFEISLRYATPGPFAAKSVYNYK